MRTRSIPLAALLFLGACGPGDKLAAVAVTFQENGLREAVTEASVLEVDASGADAQQAAEAAGRSASRAPEAVLPLNVCRVLEGGPRAGGVTAFRLLDPGSVSVKGPSGTLSLAAQAPDAGDGTAMTGSAPDADLPYEAGGVYTVEAAGAEGPGFSVAGTAPPSFDVELIGYSSPGPGTMSVPSRADLKVTWAPAADGTELYLLLDMGASGIACRVTDDGEFTIEKGLLGELPVGDGTFSIERFVQTDFDTGFGSDSRQIPGRLRMAVQRTYKVELQ